MKGIIVLSIVVAILLFATFPPVSVLAKSNTSLEEIKNMWALFESAQVDSALSQALMKVVYEEQPELFISDGNLAYDFYFTKTGVSVGRIFPSSGINAKSWKVRALRDGQSQWYILTSFNGGETLGLRIESRTVFVTVGLIAALSVIGFLVGRITKKR